MIADIFIKLFLASIGVAISGFFVVCWLNVKQASDTERMYRERDARNAQLPDTSSATNDTESDESEEGNKALELAAEEKIEFRWT